jgi:hypothetical protein
MVAARAKARPEVERALGAVGLVRAEPAAAVRVPEARKRGWAAKVVTARAALARVAMLGKAAAADPASRVSHAGTAAQTQMTTKVMQNGRMSWR